YTSQFPILTSYLTNNISNDIKKSPIIQDAIIKHSYGGISRWQLFNEVGVWGHNNSPTITFKKDLTKETGAAVGHTPNGKGFEIDFDFATAIENIMKYGSEEDKMAA